MGLLAHQMARLIATNKHAHNQSINEYELEIGEKVPPEERERMREFMKNPNNFSVDVQRSAGLPVLGGMGNLADIFLSMKWVVGRSKDQHLITSDSPVTRISDPTTYHTVYGDGAFVNRTVRISFPLTPTRLIELTWRGEERERVVEVPRAMARRFNGIRAAQAERFVYASKRDPGITKLCRKWLGREKPTKIALGNDKPSIQVKRKL